jgi:hypothetical protein
MTGLLHKGIKLTGAQKVIVSPNTVRRRTDRVTRGGVHVRGIIDVLDVRQRDTFFLSAAPHNQRVARIKHCVGKTKIYFFHEPITEDGH